MRKILIVFFSILICTNISLANTIVYEKPDVKIIIEGDFLELGAEVPIIVNSRTLVPLRKLLVGLGVPDNTENIQWIGDTREVRVIYNGININLAIDNSKAYINGQEYTLDSAPVIYRDRTYLPARFVGEALGYTISWDQYTPAVLVTSNENMNKLTEILNDLNTAMDRVKSYETISVKTSTLETNVNQQPIKYSHKESIIERADMKKQIMYVEKNILDDYKNEYIFSYNTPSYSLKNTKQIVSDGFYESGWQKEENIVFSEQSHRGILNFEKSLSGSLIFEEYQDFYLVGTVSNQIDVLKVLDGAELYNDITKNGIAQDFYFLLSIDKQTKLPTNLVVKYTLFAGEKYTEAIEYMVEYSEYNQDLNIKLPNM